LGEAPGSLLGSTCAVFAIALVGEDCTVWRTAIEVFTTIYFYDRELEAIDIGPGRFFGDIGLGAAGQ